MADKKVRADTNLYDTVLVVSKSMEQFFGCRGDTMFYDALLNGK